MTDCNTGVQPPDWCPTTTDDVLPQLVELLPQGPAWEAGRVDGTVMNKYWRSAATPLAYFNQRVCDYVEELFCTTANESIDQWNLDYGIGAACDPWPDLCTKATTLGSPTCEYFVAIALEAKWVIDCEPVLDCDPMAGCFECGCTMLGPTPVLKSTATFFDRDKYCPCDYGEVVDHPEPQFWRRDLTANASCPVPGSNLGEGWDYEEGCCFIVGYYDFDVEVQRSDRGICTQQGVVIDFGCPPQRCPPEVDVPTDSTGMYCDYGCAHTWRVIVDIPASQVLQQVDLTNDFPCAAGDFVCGCSPICTPENDFILCALEKVRPAHTKVYYELKY